MAELRGEMASMKESLAALKDAAPVLNAVRQLDVAFGGMTERMDPMEGTVDGIAAQIHGPVMKPVAEFPIRDEAKLDALIQKITENPSSRHALVM